MKYNIKSQEQYMAALQDIKDTLTAGHVIQYLKITYADDGPLIIPQSPAFTINHYLLNQ